MAPKTICYIDPSAGRVWRRTESFIWRIVHEQGQGYDETRCRAKGAGGFEF